MRKKFYAAIFYELDVDGDPPAAEDALAVMKRIAEQGSAARTPVEGGALARVEWGIVPKMEYQRVRFLARLGRDETPTTGQTSS